MIGLGSDKNQMFYAILNQLKSLNGCRTTTERPLPKNSRPKSQKMENSKNNEKRPKMEILVFFLDIIGVRTCCFDDNSPNMHLKDEKSAKFCLFKMMNLTKIAFLDLILPISRYFPLWSLFC